MKRAVLYYLLVGIFLTGSLAKAQTGDSIRIKAWEHNPSISFYIFSDDFYVVPVYKVNRNWMHLEARYNYEDRNTFSAWFGYNFSGGNTFRYSITPMAAGLVGNTNGIAPGLELDLEFYGFELYAESEFVFDLQSSEGDFFYNWTEFSWSPTDWLWFGAALQRTRIYQTDLYLQPGLLLGGGYRWFSLTGYVFNLGLGDTYGIITFSVNIPEE